MCPAHFHCPPKVSARINAHIPASPSPSLFRSVSLSLSLPRRLPYTRAYFIARCLVVACPSVNFACEMSRGGGGGGGGGGGQTRQPPHYRCDRRRHRHRCCYCCRRSAMCFCVTRRAASTVRMIFVRAARVHTRYLGVASSGGCLATKVLRARGASSLAADTSGCFQFVGCAKCIYGMCTCVHVHYI